MTTEVLSATVDLRNEVACRAFSDPDPIVRERYRKLELHLNERIADLKRRLGV